MAGFLNKPKSPTGKPSASAVSPIPGSRVLSGNPSEPVSEVRRDHDTRHPDTQSWMRRQRGAC